MIAHAKKETFLFFFVLGLGCVPCCSSPSWLGGVRKGIRKVSNDLQRRQMIFMYIYIYIYRYVYIYKYTYMYIYICTYICKRPLAESQGTCSVTAFAVQEPPPPAEKNALSLSVQHTNTKYMFLRRTLGAKGCNGTQPIAAYHAKAEWLNCRSSSVSITTNTRGQLKSFTYLYNGTAFALLPAGTMAGMLTLKCAPQTISVAALAHKQDLRRRPQAAAS